MSKKKKKKGVQITGAQISVEASGGFLGYMQKIKDMIQKNGLPPSTHVVSGEIPIFFLGGKSLNDLFDAAEGIKLMADVNPWLCVYPQSKRLPELLSSSMNAEDTDIFNDAVEAFHKTFRIAELSEDSKDFKRALFGIVQELSRLLLRDFELPAAIVMAHCFACSNAPEFIRMAYAISREGGTLCVKSNGTVEVEGQTRNFHELHVIPPPTKK